MIDFDIHRPAQLVWRKDGEDMFRADALRLDGADERLQAEAFATLQVGGWAAHVVVEASPMCDEDDDEQLARDWNGGARDDGEGEIHTRIYGGYATAAEARDAAALLVAAIYDVVKART